jgi:hypothetical protein
LPHFFSFRVKSSNAVAAAASKEEEEEDIHKNNGRKGKTIFQHVHLRGNAMFLGVDTIPPVTLDLAFSGSLG